MTGIFADQTVRTNVTLRMQIEIADVKNCLKRKTPARKPEESLTFSQSTIGWTK